MNLEIISYCGKSGRNQVKGTSSEAYLPLGIDNVPIHIVGHIRLMKN
jgi:hypothetical protein